MLRRRFLLSLVVALSLSTLASANSAPVNIASLHSGTSVYLRAYTSPNHFSINGGKATPVMFDAFNNHISMGENRNAQGSGLILEKSTFGMGITDYKATRSTFLEASHGTISRKNCGWAEWHYGTQTSAPMATPEPGSLMLLSTGLIGIAGTLRRKLLRG